MEYILLAVVVVGFAVGFGAAWLKRRWQAPLRCEIRSKNITFRTNLTEVKERQSGALFKWLALNSVMALYVRGDSIEISSRILLFRVIMGTEYYFKARETFIEVSKEPGRFYGGVNWIIVTGTDGGKEIKLAITNGDENKFRDAWNALVAAGSVAVGPPPKTHAVPGVAG